MKFILFTFSLLTFQFVSAQDFGEQLTCKLDSYSSFEQFSKDEFILKGKLFDNSLAGENGCSEYSIVLRSGGKKSTVINDTTYYIYLNVHEDRIFWKRLFAIVPGGYDSEATTPFSFEETDRSEMRKVIKTHNKLYRTNISIKDVLNGSGEDFGAYGYNCGGIGVRVKGYLKLIPLISERNENELREMSGSFDPSERAFGVTGLVLLERRGVSLNATSKHRMEVARNSEVMIGYTSGCISDQKKMKEVLADEKIDQLYYCLLHSGLTE